MALRVAVNSPNGRWIVFGRLHITSDGYESALFIVRAKGGKVKQRAAGIDPADLAEVAGHTVETATARYTQPLRRSDEPDS